MQIISTERNLFKTNIFLMIYMLTSEKFIAVYANLPINLRTEIIIVIDDKPITWNVAYKEINGNTELGKRILKKLDELKIIE